MSVAETGSGRVAIVTAAAAGIGSAIATRWCRDGGSCVMADTDTAGLETAVAALAASGARVCGVAGDVCRRDVANRVVERALAEFGRLDALFNVVGVSLPRNVEEISEEEWRDQFDANLGSVFQMSKPVIPVLRSAGGGAIVNVASTAGILAENRCSAYSASKGGVILLTKNMALDFARDNIRVNAIAPGGTRTPRIERFLSEHPEHASMMTDICVMQRFAQPEEIAAPAVFLASPDASFITGAVLPVDGGMTAGVRFPAFEAM
ncbi:MULTISPECIES: SDR family NAD(P)-dependent oxidoreductase [Mycobacteriaceae]|uniref:SDR family NAD(P)-dependent oxidoreductase n=1 Tax=Mycobacteriaceae TaxID=1762 RepID=UPI000641B707|nr:glucose 1-dehydrogenase [Mycobacterium sp. EPa45]AKK27880.1 oxidoreductase [Mycobacterium sp. EPa45]